MPFYETVYIARQDLGESQVKDLTEGYKKIIEAGNGKVKKVENWGLKTLAYKIQKNRRGHYVLMEFEADGPVVHEVERTMRLNEDVLRYMTIRLEEPTNGPSVMMDKTSRDTGEDNKKEAA
jgi:small subunit ribosomal protein S6